MKIFSMRACCCQRSSFLFPFCTHTHTHTHIHTHTQPVHAHMVKSKPFILRRASWPFRVH
jgi:hypothetical protein